jgi:hypothetical protein
MCPAFDQDKMRTQAQLLVSLAGLAAVLLIGALAAVARTPSSPRTDCAVVTATVPADYWYYHALAASHPSLFDPGTGSAPCPARKVTRT